MKKRSSAKRRTVSLRHVLIVVSGLLIVTLYLEFAVFSSSRPIRVETTHQSTTAQSSTAGRKVCQGARQRIFAAPSNISIVPSDQRISFIQGGYEKIEKGSGDINAAGSFLAALSQVQFANGIYGSVGELGVHHGRFTGFLYLTAVRTEKLVAVDLFEELQDNNVDLSGWGDFQKFVQGLQSYGLSESDLYQVFKGSTTDIAMDWPPEKSLSGASYSDAKRKQASTQFEGFRLISVDAGHTAELTLHDLQLSFCNLLPGGIVILDDWFHPRWPGVVEGFYRFVDQENSMTNDFVGAQVYPFLLCESKLYVTNNFDAYNLYIKRLISDPVMGRWMSTLAKEGRARNRTWPYQMVKGTVYARCDSSTLPSVEKAKENWLRLLSVLHASE